MKVTRSFGNGRYHEVVECGELVYLAGVTSGEKDVTAQTRDALRHIEKLLAHAGSDKDHILRATIYLKSMADFAAMNAVWDAWVSKDHAPARATVEANLADEALLVEIAIDAVKKG